MVCMNVRKLQGGVLDSSYRYVCEFKNTGIRFGAKFDPTYQYKYKFIIVGLGNWVILQRAGTNAPSNKV